MSQKLGVFLTSVLSFGIVCLSGCGQQAFLHDVLLGNPALSSGDIVIVSGGTVGRTVTPFPLHQISAFHYDGQFKSIVRAAKSTSLFMGITLTPDLAQLIYTVDTIDRVEGMKLTDTNTTGNYILDPNLGGRNPANSCKSQ